MFLNPNKKDFGAWSSGIFYHLTPPQKNELNFFFDFYTPLMIH